ncbi:phage tail tape measure protein [Maridesulfovibrio sp.]|uniref:phage tail tape measure protein n=1 Tax=Maridesulfovibrio sp. TaxID=2795000 RepID=UPI0029CA9F0F|nr:phage tail tape measure protein [Maridesulfovibrio sp.]
MSKLEKLTFSIDVMARKAMGTMGKVQNSLDSIATKARSAFRDIGYGAAQGFGALVQPAMEFNNAMRDVDSLDVQGDAMNALAQKSLLYSVKFGEGAAGFVSSAYDIQSAIGGLEGADLANFTNASNVLAKGTKADAATVTAYMGTMYGIFKQDAEAMGKSNWVEKIAGQTAAAVQMFKTTGTEMSGAFSTVGAAAQSAGVSAAEQFAVLGTLQATMSGSEAGTKYKAFLAGVGAAQKKLGLSFTDSQGKMLPMIQVMEKLKGKFGDTLSVAESDSLKKVFGSDEAVALVKLLMNDTDNLSASLQKLNGITDITQAEAMAMKRVDPFQRMVQGINAVQIVIGRFLTPVLDTLFNWIASVTEGIVKWTEAYPEAAKWIAYAGLAIWGFTGVLSTLTMAARYGKIAMQGWSSAVSAWTTVTKVAMFFTKGWRSAQMLLNAAFVSNPIGVVIAGIAASIGVLLALLPYLTGLWESFKNSFGDTWWGKALIAVLDPVMNWLKSLGKAVGWVLEKLGLSFDVSSQVEQQVTQKHVPDSTANDALLQTGVIPAAPTVPQVQSLQQMKQPSVPAGGIKQELTNISNKNSSNSSNSGPVTNNYYGPHSNTNEQFALGIS